MKSHLNIIILLFFICSIFALDAQTQDSTEFELSYDVHRVYPSFSKSKDHLKQACNLEELHSLYKPSWIKEFISVEFTAIHKGNPIKASAADDILSQAQKELLLKADIGTDISIKVHYIPDNTLKHNDPKVYSFSFSVDPDKNAAYSGGEKVLKQYLKENAMDKLPKDRFRIHQLTAVKFSIDETGKVVDVEMAESSSDVETDELLLTTIQNMPDWFPAEYTDGTRVKQDFVFTAGDWNSCVKNLLHIRHDL